VGLGRGKREKGGGSTFDARVHLMMKHAITYNAHEERPTCKGSQRHTDKGELFDLSGEPFLQVRAWDTATREMVQQFNKVGACACASLMSLQRRRICHSLLRCG